MVEVAVGIGYELTNTPRAEGPGQEGGTTVKDEEAEGDKKVRAVREVSEGGSAGHEERERRRASREERAEKSEPRTTLGNRMDGRGARPIALSLRSFRLVVFGSPFSARSSRLALF